jgi:hypothetical protein
MDSIGLEKKILVCLFDCSFKGQEGFSVFLNLVAEISAGRYYTQGRELTPRHIFSGEFAAILNSGAI